MPLFKKRDLPNPGRLEELKKEAQAVLSPDVFEGARFEFNKSFGQKFALLHNITMVPGMPGGYEFGANFGDDKLLLASRINMQGALTGRANWQPVDNILLRAQTQVQPEGGNTFKVDADYKGGDFSAGAYFFGGGLVGASYLQSLSEGLSLGVEGFYHLLNQKGGGAGALRYAWGHKGSSVLTAKAGTFGNGMLELAYQRKVTEKVALATELQYYHGQICLFGLGYEFKLRSAVFKGLISSDTTCSAVLEERISQGGGIGLTLSGMLNHKKKDYKFGIGLSLEGMGVGP